MDRYIQYLEQVLGLKQVILPEVQPPAADSTSASVPAENTLRVLFLADKPWSPKARDLFLKMREAMKLPEKQTRVLFASEMSWPEIEIAALSAERVVCFSENLFAKIHVDSHLKFHTHNPEDLLSRPQLKKETWEDLKKVMKSLGLL